MKRKTLYAFGLSAVLGFSTLSGCGCGAVQTSEPTQQEISTVEEESTSAIETIEQEETPSIVETEAVETASGVTVTEEANSSEEIEIIEMDAVMYATTSVNERKEPSADSEKIGGLSIGEEVHVTGKTEDGLWMRIEEGEGEAFVASNYLSTEKPVVEEESPATSESESTSSNGGSTDSSTTTPSTEAPVTEVPQQQETVVLEPAPAPEDLPEAPAPDNPSAWESLGEPEYTDGSEFAPTLGDGSNLGTGYEGQGTGMTWQ